jgi:hypothetical protein
VSGSLTVQAPANFQVSNLQPTGQTVSRNSIIDFSATVENVGDVQGTQNVTLAIGGFSNTQTLTLGAGENTTFRKSLSAGAIGPGSYTPTISSANDTATGSLTVVETPNFEVSNLQPQSATVTNGSTLTVSATVTNTGGVQGTQTVTLSIDGVSDTKSVTLDAGSNRTVEFQNVDTGALGPGTYTHEIASANDSASGTLTVQAGADFEVSNLTPATPTVTNGTALTISADVENFGDVQETQTITLTVGGLTVTQQVTLNASEQTTVEFQNVDTGALGPGTYTHEIASANDSVSGSLTVQAPANFAVTIDSTNSGITEGENLDVQATIENTGDVQATQTITLDVGALGTNSTAVTLGGGESATRTLSLETGAGEAGEYTATVSSANGSASQNVTVLAPSNFEVAIDSTNTPVTEGETLTVNATVENTGDVSDTQPVTLSVGALGTDSTPVTLAGEANTTVTLAVGTGAGDAGSYTATVDSDDDSNTAAVTVQAPAGPAQSLTFENQTLDNGTVLVKNVSSDGVNSLVLVTYQNGSDLVVAGLTVGTFSGQNVSVSLVQDDGFPGEYTAHILPATARSQDYQPGDVVSTATAANITASETATVSEGIQYDLTNAELVPDTVPSNATVSHTLNYTVTDASNDGNGDTHTVTLPVGAEFAGGTPNTLAVADANGASIAISSSPSVVNANGGTDNRLTFEVQPDSAFDTSEVDVSLNVTVRFPAVESDTTENVDINVTDSKRGTTTAQTPVTIEAVPDPANFQVSDLQPATATVDNGTLIDIQANVTNTGEIQGTQTMTLSIDGLSDSRPLVLDPGQTKTVQFQNVDTGVLGPGVFTHEIASANDSASGSLTVSGEVFVESYEVSATELALNETLTVDATVRNTGVTTANLSVPLRVDGQTVDTATVQVGASAATTVTLQADSLPLGNASVSVANLAATQVTVLGPDLIGLGDPARDTDGDGKYEDVDGSGTFDILDVQALFNNLDNPALVNNAGLFNFQTTFPDVSTLDVQALFNELPGN